MTGRENRDAPRPAARLTRAFTLIELLVVIAIIAILAALLLPVLGKAKMKVQAASCRNHLKQLQICWELYSDDHAGSMPPNMPIITGSRDRLSDTTNSWVVGNAWADTGYGSIERGVLFQYSKSRGIYRCPADKSTVRDQGKVSRNRSVSLSCYMNAAPHPSDGDFRLFWHKVSEIRNPNPAGALTFIDEHEKSLQQGTFGINAPNYHTFFGTPLWTWISFPATRHGNAGTMCFADGHTELRRWREPNTLRISAQDDWLVLQPAANQSDRDLALFFKGIPWKVPIR